MPPTIIPCTVDDLSPGEEVITRMGTGFPYRLATYKGTEGNFHCFYCHSEWDDRTNSWVLNPEYAKNQPEDRSACLIFGRPEYQP